MGAEEGLDVLTRMDACSPEQLLSLFPFTSAYAVEIRDGRYFTLCLTEKWQLWSATILAVLLAILTHLSLFYLFSALERRYPLILWVYLILKFLQVPLYSFLVAYICLTIFV